MSEPLDRLRNLQLELPERGTGARSARRTGRAPDQPVQPAARRPSRRWMAVFAGLLAVAAVLGAVLTYIGVDTVRQSTTGRAVATLEPDEPGFEAFLEPTPTLLVVHERDGELLSLALLSLHARDAGGAVVVIPPSARLGQGEGDVPLSVSYAFGGGEALLRQVHDLVGVGIGEQVTVDDARWAHLTSPVAPLTVENPDDLEGFPRGPVQLEGEAVAGWLAAQAEAESELGRMYRIQLFWDAWLGAVAAADDPAAVPGELDSGLGRFVRGLAGGAREIATLPLVEEPSVDGPSSFRLDPVPAAELITQAVPFPRSTAGDPRTRVRLLDGTGAADHALRAAPLIVPAGAEIVVVGNAEAFRSPRDTEVRYHDAARRDDAERLRDAIGVGEVVEDVRQVDSFDVTIVLGTDI